MPARDWTRVGKGEIVEVNVGVGVGSGPGVGVIVAIGVGVVVREGIELTVEAGD